LTPRCHEKQQLSTEERMSGTTSAGNTTGQSTYQAAKDALGSAAEQARAAAPSAYGAAERGTQYVSGTVSEYPLTILLATAGVAYLLGWLSSSSGDRGMNWQDRAKAVRQGARSMSSSLPEMATNASQRGRSATNYATRSAADASDYLRQTASGAGDYVTQSVRDYPTSALVGVAAVGAVLGYLLRGRT
jgi:ElaB/YqjD/DUF883 family membrane-anchored ribosome-binding protein